MRYLMIVTYDGKTFNGFQKQNSKNTIQDHLEKAISTILKEQVTCVGSGRTDAKVSAFFQPVHFDCSAKIETKKFIHSMNGVLPADIRVLSVVPTELHARFSAKKKTYVYKMYVSNIDLPLKKDALRINPNLNFRLMKKFARLLVGTHNFAGFMASGSEVESTTRTIYSAKLKRNGLNLTFSITGNGFLYKMVRNIVGTMLKIGEEKLDLTELKQTLFTTFKATNTAKPEYLYLAQVEYKK